MRNIITTRYLVMMTMTTTTTMKMMMLLMLMLCFLVPPSYEESTTAGRVDIREEADSEHIGGELRWCPKYPIYRQLSVRQGASAPPLEPSQ